jgi:hypothetical protein
VGLVLDVVCANFDCPLGDPPHHVPIVDDVMEWSGRDGRD